TVLRLATHEVGEHGPGRQLPVGGSLALVILGERGEFAGELLLGGRALYGGFGGGLGFLLRGSLCIAARNATMSLNCSRALRQLWPSPHLSSSAEARCAPTAMSQRRAQ